MSLCLLQKLQSLRTSCKVKNVSYTWSSDRGPVAANIYHPATYYVQGGIPALRVQSLFLKGDILKWLVLSDWLLTVVLKVGTGDLPGKCVWGGDPKQLILMTFLSISSNMTKHMSVLVVLHAISVITNSKHKSNQIRGPETKSYQMGVEFVSVRKRKRKRKRKSFHWRTSTKWTFPHLEWFKQVTGDQNKQLLKLTHWLIAWWFQL